MQPSEETYVFRAVLLLIARNCELLAGKLVFHFRLSSLFFSSSSAVLMLR